MCIDKDYEIKIKLYDHFLWTGLTCLPVLYHYWALDYFQSYVNQKPERLSHRFYNLRIGKD